MLHKTTRIYRPELDALRFFAFALVFVFHAAASIRGEMSAAGGASAFLASALPVGKFGVDVFFLLSAYLIMDLFVRERERSGTVDVPAFYARRILRIWPLYFLFVLAMLALSAVSPVELPDGAVMPMLLFYGNFWIAGHEFFSPAGILWSISIEEQFYLFAPLVILMLNRSQTILLCGALVLVAVFTRFLILQDPTLDPEVAWYVTPARLDPIALGILACLLLRGRVPTLASGARALLFVAGMALLALAATWLPGEGTGVAHGNLAYPIATAGALAIFLSFLGAAISWRPLCYLGRISFGLYVFHLFGLNVAKVALLHLTGTCPFLLRAAIGLAITLALAAASHAWLEMPFLRLKDCFARDGAFKAAPTVPVSPP